MAGTAFFEAGRAYERLRWFDSALRLYRESWAADSTSAGPVAVPARLRALASMYLEVGVRDSALARFGDAFLGYEAKGDTAALLPVLIGVGRTYTELGRPDSALYYLGSAIRLMPYDPDSVWVGTLYSHIGWAFYQLGKADTALAYMETAVEEEGKHGSVVARGISLRHLGRLYQSLGRFNEAADRYRESLRLPDPTGDASPWAETLPDLGIGYARFGMQRLGLDYMRRALAVSHANGYRELEARTLTYIGMAYHAVGVPDKILLRGGERRDLRRAVAYYDSASAVRAQVEVRAGSDANQAALREGDHALYALWARAWLDLRDSVGAEAGALSALAAMERGHAQALLDLLRSHHSDTLSALAMPGLALTAPGANLEHEGRALVEGIQPESGSILAYLTTDDYVFVWLIRPGVPTQVFATPVRPGELEALVSALHVRVGNPRPIRPLDARASSTSPDSEQIGAMQLGDILARLGRLVLPTDLLQALPRSGAVLVVPHGPIGLIPFAALPGGPAGKYFGEQHSVRYSPSLAALRVIESRSSPLRSLLTRSAPGNAAFAGSLVVAAPTMPLDPEDPTGHRSLRALRSDRSEARWVADSLLHVPVLSGGVATAARVLERLPQAPVVLFATHGMAYPTDARSRLSWLAVAPEPTAAALPGDVTPEHGFLTIAALLDEQALRMRAELVMLSACQTGMGNLKQLEGSMGLQRAFLAAGARSVIASLWSVDDDVTALLVRRFFTHWLGGRTPRDKAEALRLAQNDVARSYPSPYYWAAFQLYGADDLRDRPLGAYASMAVPGAPRAQRTPVHILADLVPPSLDPSDTATLHSAATSGGVRRPSGNGVVPSQGQDRYGPVQQLGRFQDVALAWSVNLQFDGKGDSNYWGLLYGQLASRPLRPVQYEVRLRVTCADGSVRADTSLLRFPSEDETEPAKFRPTITSSWLGCYSSLDEERELTTEEKLIWITRVEIVSVRRSRL